MARARHTPSNMQAMHSILLNLFWGQPNDYLLVQLNFMTCKACVQIFLIIWELCKGQRQNEASGQAHMTAADDCGDVIIVQ